ncbi:alpha-ribazole phosphatase [Clostridium oryzae]|uniref:Alpha-ribazole phosphatase n=1 Tax=Clostridium oryzae TaxID=1450648 RepID=A0A1V4IT44_9CLOT|nr:alpha-ribazole phosphatase [Clostridium oryzae]OPJ63069.1 alpha-ribazole phosphatase [Clostridium oryzae]
MNVYLVRHGQSQSNVERRYCGNYDSNLTDIGRKQAETVRQKLQYINFDAVFCSDRTRAKETAQIILKDKNIKIAYDVRLNETNFGIFENKKYDEIKKLYPEESTQWERNWKNYAIPEGESVAMSFERVKNFMKRLESIQQPDSNVLVVTHGGILRLFYCYILNHNIELFWKFSAKNIGVSVIKYEYDNWYIDSIGI